MKIIVAMAFFLISCTHDIKRIASGSTGCYPEEISIDKTDIGWRSSIVYLSCRGKNYICTNICTEIRMLDDL